MPENSTLLKGNEVLKRALHPPLRDPRFWVVQISVGLLTVVHFILDVGDKAIGDVIATLPIFLLLIPVGYAALRFGLHGSAATAFWSTILWIPDVFLSHHHDSLLMELIALMVVDVVGIIVGHRIEKEELAKLYLEQAEISYVESESRFRHLFAQTRAPILLVDSYGKVVDANPAAWGVFGKSVLDKDIRSILSLSTLELSYVAPSNALEIKVDGKEYEFRCLVSTVGSGESQLMQILLQDITEERRAYRDVRGFASSLMLAQEDERQRIARELHDDPLQSILHIARQLDTIKENLAAICSNVDRGAEVTSDIEEVTKQLLTAARSIRNLSQGLRPPSLETLGYIPALKGLIVDSEATFDIPISLSISGEVKRLDREIELGLFRICQEGIRNSLLHASPSKITVVVEFQIGMISVLIEDNGIGFNPTIDAGSSHLGLRGMRERANILGGTLKLTGKEGLGTSIRLSVPI